MKRPRIKKNARPLFCIALLGLVIFIVHIALASHGRVFERVYQHTEIRTFFKIFKNGTIKRDPDIPPQFIASIDFSNSSGQLNPQTLEAKELDALGALKQKISQINEIQFIHNLHNFSVDLTSDSVVIVIQAHDRPEYLRNLLESLQAVEKIEESLVVISHDVYSEEMNKIVAEVDFCRVMQIFFPFSVQLYPYTFPGEDPDDCDRNMKIEEALSKKCNNAKHPDIYGHYRQATVTQAKHHWFWKLHFVFEELRVLKNYQGLVLLLEEDYYVMPDIISTLQMAWKFKHTNCTNCKIVCAGNHQNKQNYELDSGQVHISDWVAGNNIGMTFTVDFWNDIRKCAKEFCYYDDYNWDWTLQHVRFKCITNEVKVLQMKATRVYHMGECGMHHKKKSCSSEEKKRNVQRTIMLNRNHIFPLKLDISYTKTRLSGPKPFGGWGDTRDRQLCLSYVNPLPNNKN